MAYRKRGKVGRGKGASAISDRSGMRFPMSEMVLEPGTNYLVHRSESDGKWSVTEHPLNNLGYYLKHKSGDPFPVENARPDIDFTVPINSVVSSDYTASSNYTTDALLFSQGSTSYTGVGSLSVNILGPSFRNLSLAGVSSYTTTSTVAKIGTANYIGLSGYSSSEDLLLRGFTDYTGVSSITFESTASRIGSTGYSSTATYSTTGTIIDEGVGETTYTGVSSFNVTNAILATVSYSGIGTITNEGVVVKQGTTSYTGESAFNPIIAPFESQIYMDATNTSSASSSSSWKDLATNTDWVATNVSLLNAGTPSATFGFSGSGFIEAPSNYGQLEDLHKTTAGNKWTIVVIGETTGTDNRFMFGTNATVSNTDGIHVKYEGDTDFQFTQFGGGSQAKATPFKIPNSSTFMVVLGRDEDTDSTFHAYNTVTRTEFSQTFQTSTAAPNSVMTLGGLSGGGSWFGNIKSFMLIEDTYADAALVTSIYDHFDSVHGQDYANRSP